MNIETKRIKGAIGVLVLSGDLNTGHLGAFKAEITQLLSEDFKKIIIDCRDLGFISSSGLAALLWARSSAASIGSRIYLTHVSSFLGNILEITKLSKLLRIEQTTRQLLERFGGIRKRPSKEKKRTPHFPGSTPVK